MSTSVSRGKPLDVGQAGVDQTQLPGLDFGPLDLHAWFEPWQGDPPTPPMIAAPAEPNAALPPLELEIGSGKGTFLVQQAPQTPDVRYLGMEYAAAYYRYAADRVRRHAMPNVRMLHAEAGAFVRNYVPGQCFRQIHIYFPDPWPKKRHNKRRLVQAPFLRELHRVLRDEPSAVGREGKPPLPPQIRIATDHVDYFAWMEEHAAQVTDIFERVDFESPESAGEGELVGTNFERKYRREGRPFQGMVLIRK